MSVLIVVAHPDDEGLGCGGTAWALSQAGRTVSSCILSGNVEVRDRRPSDQDLAADIEAAHARIGIRNIILGKFPNIAFNNVPHIDLVRFIEDAIVSTRAEAILTHHPNDLNNDHRHTALACLAASRLGQRRADAPVVRAVYLMEVLSSTDWGFPAGHDLFQPNSFFPIGEEGLRAKISSLESYRGVMQPYPHPRSQESLRALATVRGSQAGMSLAEAFQLIYERKSAVTL